MTGTERDAQQRVRALAAGLAEAVGVDLVDVQMRGAGARRLVRVVVDRKGGIDLAACQRLSQRLGAALDAADEIDSRYVLEVTSPGVSHPLTDRAAFDRVEGRSVVVHRRDGAATVSLCGTVTAAEDDAVVLDVDGSTTRVPYGQIVKATQALPW